MNPRNMVDKGHGYRTLNQGRILGHLQCERHLPSAHLYSALWQGSLLKIRWVYDEEKAAAYLGPGGEATHPYTWRMAAKDLQRPPFNIHCFGDDDEIMLFSPHWSGIGGILEGTDCGDQCSEALHSAWQAEKQRVADAMPKAKGLDVLNNMQTLYDTAWKSWFGWEKPSALYAFPRGEDPNVLNGASLSKAGRSHAIALWTASQSKQIHAIFDIGDRTQVVAMVRDLSVNFSPTDAEAGSRMLFASGQELQTMLEHDGLVQWVQCIDDNLRLCTAPERVNDVFVKHVYVIVSNEGTYYPSCRRGIICTCKWFCRYARCEHVRFASMLDMRLHPSTGAPHDTPSTAPRGRKRGACVAEPPRSKKPKL